MVADAIVFEITVATFQRALHRRRQAARPHKHANGHRHFLRCDHGFHQRLFTRIVAVGFYIHAGRLRSIVLRRDEKRDVAHGTGKNFTRGERELLRGPHQDLFRLNRRRLIVGNGTRLRRGGGAAARERLDEPLQVRIVAGVLPQINLRARRLLAAEIVQPHARRVLGGESVAAVGLLRERPTLPGLAPIGFQDDRRTVLGLALRHRQHERRIGRRFDGVERVPRQRDHPLLV